MSDTTPATFSRQQAAAEYEEANPKPTPPTPSPSRRPSVIRPSNGVHVWIDVQAESDYRGARVFPKLYVIQRSGNEDQRIEGELSEDELHAFIHELLAVHGELTARKAFQETLDAHDKASKDWEDAKDVYVREQQLAWERARAEEKKK